MNIEEVKTAKARRHHLDFMRYMWQRTDPFIVGIHTRAICEKIDYALERYKNDKSTYLSIKVPFRHGKSDIVSRYLPANFLGKYPDSEIIVSGHSAKLVYRFSRYARRLIRDRKFQKLYPGVTVSQELSNVAEWGLEDKLALAQWIGLGGGLSGTGGNLIILDDFFKDRAEAESETVRNTRWEAVTNDLMTRMAPVCIFVILATPWHVDDIFARVRKHMNDDANFPRFEELKFPAFSDKYETGVLFPERFSREWYEGQKAQLGTYGAASLMQCDPVVRSGNFLRTDKIHIVDGLDDPNLPEALRGGLRFGRAWDLASTKKERIKESPDWTIGVHGAVKLIPTAIKDVTTPMIYIDDVVRGQWEGLQRQKVIQDVAIADGAIPVGIEAFGAYKDAFTALRDILHGIRSVRKMQLPGDKTAKADPLVPIFEAGNVYLKRAAWNEPFIKCLTDFPNGEHDDDADALAVLHHMMVKKSLQIFTTASLAQDESEGENG